jgi:translation initiation factor 1
MMPGERIPTDGGRDLTSSPFASLNLGDLPAGPAFAPASARGKPLEERKRGRIEIRREKAGRGGKIVTTLSGFTGISAQEKETLARDLQRRCGCGGSVKAGVIEIQGDQRETCAEELRKRGFQPVFAGG